MKKMLIQTVTALSLVVATFSAHAEIRSTIQGDRDSLIAQKNADGTIALNFCRHDGECTRLGSRSYTQEELKSLSANQKLKGRLKMGGAALLIPAAAFLSWLSISYIAIETVALVGTAGAESWATSLGIGTYIGMIGIPVGAGITWHVFNPLANTRAGKALGQANIDGKDVTVHASIESVARDVSAALLSLDNSASGIDVKNAATLSIP